MYLGVNATNVCLEENKRTEALYIQGGTLSDGKVLYVDSNGSTVWNNTFWTHIKLSNSSTHYALDLNGSFRNEIGSSGTCTTYEYFSTYSENNGESSSTFDTCLESGTVSIYSAKSSLESIAVGNVLYSNSSRTSTWNGNGKWYGIANSNGGSPGTKLQISSQGVVDDIDIC